MGALSAATIALVRKVFAFFREHGAWPEKEPLVVELDEHGQDLDDILREAPSITVQRDEQGIERVVLGFDAVVLLPEGQELFEPLPTLIKLAVDRFSEHPSWATVHDPKTLISFDEIVGVWRGRPDAALLAGKLMRGSTPAVLSPNFNAGGDSYSLAPQVEALRYATVKTLDDVLRIHDYRTRPRPTEETLTRFTNRVFAHMRQHRDWPNPIRAAIEWREFGFVPDLVNDLHAASPRIVREQFGYFPNDGIELLLWSVTTLNDGEYWRQRVPRFVRALYMAWKEAPGQYKPLALLATAAGLPIVDATVLALLTEHEPWAKYQTRVEGLKLSDWNLSAHETIRHAKESATWADYVRVRVEKWPGWADHFGQSNASASSGGTVIVEREQADEINTLALAPTARGQANILEESYSTSVPRKPSTTAGTKQVASITKPVPQAQPRAKVRAAPRAARGDATDKPTRPPKYDFDAAVSFAGECREYVEQVVRAMERLGIRVFYDYDQQHDLWGKDLLAYLDNIYRKKARYCVVFISRHYAKKPWPKHERKSAQAREFKAQREYILPVRMDDTEIPGLLATKGHLDARRMSPAEIAEHLRKKLKLKPA